MGCSIDGKGAMSATSDIRVRPPAVLLTSRPRATRTFFVWLGLCLLGFPLGGYLGYFVFGAVDGVKPAVFGGALTGAGIGFAQWVLLRRYLGTGPEWIVATSVALAAGLAIGAAVVGYETTVSALAIMGVISGAFVGLAQGLLLRGRFPLWHVWIVAMPVLWALGWLVTEAAGINVEEQFTVFGASGTVVFAALSAFLLLAGTRARSV